MRQLAVPTKFKGEKLNIQLSRELKTHSFKNNKRGTRRKKEAYNSSLAFFEAAGSSEASPSANRWSSHQFSTSSLGSSHGKPSRPKCPYVLVRW